MPNFDAHHTIFSVMDRPRHIDLPFADSRTSSSAGSRTASRAGSRAASRAGQPSPRIQHYDGDIPPSLSPLDAFAAHSRRLAKELEETRLAGQRRMSRLPPQVVTKSLSQHQANRPAIFRSLSSNSEETVPPLPQIERDSAGNSPDVTAPKFRPTSTYPRISAVLGPGDQSRSQTSTPIDYPEHGHLNHIKSPNDYFSPHRAESPDPLDGDAHTTTRHQTKHSNIHELADVFPALAPPNAAFARNRPYNESSDDDYTSSNAGSFFSQTRKLSSSSNVSLTLGSSIVHNRSSSNNSSSSLSGHKNIPSHLNFSRPRSSASSHTKLDSPTRSQPKLLRNGSQTSELSRLQNSFDDVRSIVSDGVLSHGPSSYTHSRFILPRGRNVDRSSGVFTSPSTPQLDWLASLSAASPPSNAHQDTFSESPITPLEPPGREQDSIRSGTTEFSFEFDGERAMVNDQARPASSHTQSGSIKSNSSANVRLAPQYGAQKIPDLPPIPGSTYSSTIDGLSRSSRSNSTVRPTTSRSVSNYQNLTPDDHVTKAIDLHQHGDLKESTYHLRIAAKQDHPTGMLLYALACRHGWGMRTNPKEGVTWLKRAVNSAMLEVAEDEDTNSGKPKSDFHQRKEHRAQFALSIYELGVSHLNGWGVEQDKALALRCFEIAGTWGDPDALSEAGFCYAEGIGCKKDLKKAARFYRLAAKKGVSMIGNSWIYKDKYNEPEDTMDKENRERGRDSGSPKKGSASAGRSKSKTRSIFGRKKSIVATA